MIFTGLRAALLAVAISTVGGTAGAAEPGPSPPKVVSSNTPDLPPDLRAKGHQGEVRLTGIVKADGSLADVQVRTSSGSAELDAFAVKAFERWQFSPARDADGDPIDQRVSTTLEFWADELMTLGEKTCAEFVADIDWRRATFPGQPDTGMRLYNLVGGMFLMGGPNRAFPTQASFDRAHKALPLAWPRTYEACRLNPKDRFLAVLIREVRR
ncbi:MAG TPA: energy transducer TonB [Caulobacter sp.]|nr:energy transducer TonB [Caulobacter sp.]